MGRSPLSAACWCRSLAACSTPGARTKMTTSCQHAAAQQTFATQALRQAAVRLCAIKSWCCCKGTVRSPKHSVDETKCAAVPWASHISLKLVKHCGSRRRSHHRTKCAGVPAPTWAPERQCGSCQKYCCRAGCSCWQAGPPACIGPRSCESGCQSSCCQAGRPALHCAPCMTRKSFRSEALCGLTPARRPFRNML